MEDVASVLRDANFDNHAREAYNPMHAQLLARRIATRYEPTETSPAGLRLAIEQAYKGLNEQRTQGGFCPIDSQAPEVVASYLREVLRTNMPTIGIGEERPVDKRGIIERSHGPNNRETIYIRTSR